MRIASLFAIIAAVIFAIFVLWEILRRTKKIGNGVYNKWVIKVSNILLIIIGCLFVFTPFNNSYYLGDDQKRNIEHHLPQIDSSMPLVVSNRFLILYKSFTKEPIRHETKTIYRDLFGYDRIEDIFVNEKQLCIDFKIDTYRIDTLMARMVDVDFTTRNCACPS
jgi:hypothetical protein